MIIKSKQEKYNFTWIWSTESYVSVLSYLLKAVYMISGERFLQMTIYLIIG